MARNLRGTVLIGSILAALCAGIGIAAAQPGATFQTQGERQSEGKTAVPSPYSRTVHSPEVRGGRHAYGYVRHHVIVRHHRYYEH
jgi:hypothetical protein